MENVEPPVALLHFIRSNRGTNFMLDPRERTYWVLGRSPTAEINASFYKYSSRRHCSFEFRGSGYFLRDLGTSNGTYLRDRRIEDDEEVQLNSGDSISVGSPSNSPYARLVIIFRLQNLKENFEIINIDEAEDITMDVDDDDDVIILDSPEPEPEIDADIIIKKEYSTLEEPVTLREEHFRKVTDSNRDIVFVDLTAELDDLQLSDEEVDAQAGVADEPGPGELIQMMQAFLKETEHEIVIFSEERTSGLSSSQQLKALEAIEADLLTQPPPSPPLNSIPPPSDKTPSSHLFPLANATSSQASPFMQVLFQEIGVEVPISSDLPLHEQSSSGRLTLTPASPPRSSTPPQLPSLASAHLPLADFTNPSRSRNVSDIIEPSRPSLPGLSTKSGSFSRRKPPTIVEPHVEKDRTGKKKSKTVEQVHAASSSKSDKEKKEERDKKLKEVALKAKARQCDKEKTETKKPKAAVKVKNTARSRTDNLASQSAVPPPRSEIKRKSFSPPRQHLENNSRCQCDPPKSLELNGSPESPTPAKRKSCLKDARRSSIGANSRTDIGRSVGFDESKNTTKNFVIEEGNRLSQVNRASQQPKTESDLLTDVIKEITHWNAAWLDESKELDGKMPPDIYDVPMKNIPSNLKNQFTYIYWYKPLLLLELWNRMMFRWHHFICNSYPVAMMGMNKFKEESLCYITCQAMVQLNETGFVKPHDIVVLYLNVAGSKAHPIIGIAERVVVSRDYDQENIHSCLKSGLSKYDGRLLMTVTIISKFRDVPALDTTDTMPLKVIGYFESQMRALEAICTIGNSPLRDLIVKPRFIPELPAFIQRPITFKPDLDEVKKTLLLKLTIACQLERPLLQVINGPPGSGKTRLIAALVIQLMTHSNSQPLPKVVLCFPRSSSLQKLLMELRYHHDDCGLSFTIKVFNREHSKRRASQDANSRLESQVSLEHADVIFCEVRDCGEIRLRQALAKSNRRVICIMDDAAQSYEPESCIPILLQTSHFILFGCEIQNKTDIINKKARKHGLGRSLFQRILDGNREAGNESSLCQLTIQYRMNPTISKLLKDLGLLKHVKMEDGRNLVVERNSCLKPFLFLVRPANSSSSKLDAYGIINAVVQSVKNIAGRTCSLAVLLPSRHVDTLRDHIRDKQTKVYSLDAYQGRDTDVVVFVTCSFGGLPAPKDVDYLSALTRARKSFIQIIDWDCLVHNFWSRVYSTVGRAAVTLPLEANVFTIEAMISKSAEA